MLRCCGIAPENPEGDASAETAAPGRDGSRPARLHSRARAARSATAAPDQDSIAWWAPERALPAVRCYQGDLCCRFKAMQLTQASQSSRSGSLQTICFGAAATPRVQAARRAHVMFRKARMHTRPCCFRALCCSHSTTPQAERQHCLEALRVTRIICVCVCTVTCTHAACLSRRLDTHLCRLPTSNSSGVTSSTPASMPFKTAAVGIQLLQQHDQQPSAAGQTSAQQQQHHHQWEFSLAAAGNSTTQQRLVLHCRQLQQQEGWRHSGNTIR